MAEPKAMQRDVLAAELARLKEALEDKVNHG